ncbi:carbohydrate ABC transporter substrate-binding protein, partial [Halorubrum sp. SD626R]
RQFEDFQNSNTQPPAIAHGTAVAPAIQSSLQEVFANFNGSQDVDAAYDGIVNSF